MSLLTRKKAGAFAVALAMAGVLLSPTQALAAPVFVPGPGGVEAKEVLDTEIRLETGHIDAFTPVLNEDDSLRLVVKEDATGSNVLRTAESVEMFVKPSAQMTVPENFLPGMPANIYHLLLTQDHNLIWPGWETQLIQGAYPAANTDIVVSEVDGPGQVFLWSQGNFGVTKSLMKDGTSYTLPNTISQPYPAHTHAAWAFTAPGTYKLTVRADVTATGDTSASTQTATYTFVVAERTQLTPAAPLQDGNTVTIPADQQWISYTDGEGTALPAGEHTLTADMTVNATPAFGFDIAEDATQSWTFEYEEPVVQTLAITGLRHHYHQGAAIVLNAVADPAVEGASTEWFLQRVDQSEPVLVAAQNTAEFRIAAEQALNGATVSARLLAADGETEIAIAPAVTIDVDDHGAAPFNVVTVAGAAHHYHTGDTAELTASVAPVSALERWEWQVQAAGDDEWVAVEGENTADYTFEVTEELNGALVRAALTYNDGTIYVVSEAVEIEIDDHHHGEEPVETELSIAGLRHHYHTGDVATLTAVQDPETSEAHYHWFIKRAGDEDYAVISGALSSELAYTVQEGDNGAQIIVKLYDHDHAVIAESAPAVIEIDDHHHAENPKPGTAPATPADTVLDGVPAGGIVLSQSTVKPGASVTVQVGEGSEHADEWVAAWMFSTPTLLGGDWKLVAQNGTIVVQIPADATAGAHRIAVFDAAGALVGWQTMQVEAAATGGGTGTGTGTGTGSGATGSGALATTGSELPLVAVGSAALLIVAASAALLVMRRRGAAIED